MEMQLKNYLSTRSAQGLERLEALQARIGKTYKSSDTNQSNSSSNTQTDIYRGVSMSLDTKKRFEEIDARAASDGEQARKLLFNGNLDKTTILSQAKQSMLAQANQSPQAALRLLG